MPLRSCSIIFAFESDVLEGPDVTLVRSRVFGHGYKLQRPVEKKNSFVANPQHFMYLKKRVGITTLEQRNWKRTLSKESERVSGGNKRPYEWFDVGLSWGQTSLAESPLFKSKKTGANKPTGTSQSRAASVRSLRSDFISIGERWLHTRGQWYYFFIYMIYEKLENFSSLWVTGNCSNFFNLNCDCCIWKIQSNRWRIIKVLGRRLP